MKLFRAWRILMAIADGFDGFRGAEQGFIQCGPNDVIIVRHKGVISHDAAMRIQDHLKVIWPNNDVLVIGDDMRIQVVQRDQVSAVQARLARA